MSIVFPYASVDGYISSHPLTDYLSLDPRDVYTTLMEMLSMSLQYDAGRSVPKMQQSCPHCKGYLREDPREGQMVCDGCGICESYIIPTNCMLYDKADDRMGSSTARKATFRLWELGDRDGYSEYLIQKEVDFLNDIRPHGFHKSADAVMEAKRWALKPKRASSKIRAMAALIEPDVRQFYVTHDFALLVRTGVPLPVLGSYAAPKKEYACAKCGAPVANMYEVRRHPCNWGQISRKRPRN